MRKYDVVMPIAEKDVDLIQTGLPYFRKNLPIKQMIVIGNDKVLERLKQNGIDKSVTFLREEHILPLSAVKKVMLHVSGGNEEAVKRSGWYLQQFLKMMYATLCQDEYYLVWDADTLPVRPIHMMEGTKPVFHMKSEYYPFYFETMGRLLSGLGKTVEKSFIAEHMLIQTKAMCHLIDEIENNTQFGEKHKFWENILYAVDKTMLPHSGFSEFETYGSYCCLRFPGQYLMKEYDSLRDGRKYFKPEELSGKETDWIAKDYMAVSFEKGQKLVPYYRIYKIRIVQKLFRFKTLYVMEHRIKEGKAKIKRKIKQILRFGER